MAAGRCSLPRVLFVIAALAASATVLGCGDKDGDGTVDEDTSAEDTDDTGVVDGDGGGDSDSGEGGDSGDGGGTDDGGAEDTGGDGGAEPSHTCSPLTEHDWTDDADRDGHIDAAAGGDDCDDSTAAISPSFPELCGNGIDDDCDGVDAACAGPESFDLLESGASVWGGERSDGGDWRVYSADVIGDVDGDGLADMVVELDCDTLFGDDDLDLVVRMSGVGASAMRPTDASAEVLATAAAGDVSVVEQVTGLGDLDGDGYEEIGIAIGDDREALAVFAGPLSGSSDADDAEAWVSGDALNVVLAGIAAAAFDTDGDAALETLFTQSSGSDLTAWLVEGPFSGEVAVDDAPVATLTRVASADTRFLGENASAGDLDGDGLDDLLMVGKWHSGANWYGGAFLLHGPVTGDLEMQSDADVTISSLDGTKSGTICSGTALPGDVNGDGYDDAVLCSVSEDEVRVFFGPLSTSTTGSAADATVSLGSADAEEDFGLAAVGDFNGDGSPDLGVGRSREQVTWIIGGPLTGTHDVSDVALLTVTSDTGSSSSNFGQRIVAPGDANGDGLDDVMVVDVNMWPGEPEPYPIGAAAILYGRGI